MTELDPLIFDNGSSFSKAGFAGDDKPHAIFPTVTARQKVSPMLGMMGSIETLVGDYALGRRGNFTYKYPIDRGLITDWDHMEKIWHYTFYNELRLCPTDYEILLMETPLNPKADREMMAKIMFEQFSVSSVYLANPGVMSLLASDKTTGLALESGDAITISVPVYEGMSIPSATVTLELGGRDLTKTMTKIFEERGYSFTLPFEIASVKEMKEKHCYVPINLEEESKKSSLLETEYELPDGIIITIGSEKFRTTEVLFKPHLIGMEIGGIHEQIVTSIRKCDVDIRKELFSNIVLSGGSTLFSGLTERLSNELQEISPSMKNRIIALPERKYQPWIGGSIFASLSTFKKMCIRKEEYDETGPNIVHRK